MVSGPSYQDTQAMKNLLNIMNGGEPEKSSSVKTDINKKNNGPIIIDNTPDSAAMKKILESFNSVANNTAKTMKEQSTYDREVREALETERTDTGSRVGSWEINVNVFEKLGKEIKTYDVVNIHSNEPIAKDLYLYEAAHGLVMLLNRGETLTSSAIREMLNFEEQYTRNRLDAIRFKKRYQESLKTRDYTTAEIMESRYDQSRSLALGAKSNIAKLYEKL